MKLGKQCLPAALLPGAVLLYLTLRAVWDFTHPRAWERPDDDPHVYAWFVAAGWLVLAGLAARVRRAGLAVRRQARVESRLAEAERLLRAGKLGEAEKVLGECKRLSGFPGG